MKKQACRSWCCVLSMGPIWRLFAASPGSVSRKEGYRWGQGARNHMKQLRLSLLGFGTVGRWLAEALHLRQAWLQQELDVVMTIVSVATAHHGFIYRGDGLDIPTLLELADTHQPLTAYPGATHWANILEGLQATGGDVLAEATGATLRSGEPGLSYIRAALAHGMHVLTSSKGPMTRSTDSTPFPLGVPSRRRDRRSKGQQPIAGPFRLAWKPMLSHKPSH